MIRPGRPRRVCPHGNFECLFPPTAGVDCSSHAFSVRHVSIGDVAVSLPPARLKALLGSCVAVCLYDPVLRAGGMNHILVPDSGGGGGCETRFGVQAMELLINALMKLGADRRRFIAKAFGGANVLPGISTPTIGERNAEFVRRFLQTERIPLLAEWLGGDRARCVVFETHSARVLARTVDVSRVPKIVRKETLWYQSSTKKRFAPEDPVIF